MGVDRIDKGEMLMNEIDSDDEFIVDELIVDDDALELAAGGIVKPVNTILTSQPSTFVVPS